MILIVLNIHWGRGVYICHIVIKYVIYSADIALHYREHNIEPLKYKLALKHKTRQEQ